MDSDVALSNASNVKYLAFSINVHSRFEQRKGCRVLRSSYICICEVRIASVPVRYIFSAMIFFGLLKSYSNERYNLKFQIIYINHLKYFFLFQITVIVKKNERCTTRKQYEVGSEDEQLPNSFTDGTIFVGNSDQKAVEIKLLNQSYIEIILRYIATTIYIRRHGAYLSVALRIPERIVEVGYFMVQKYLPSNSFYDYISISFSFISHIIIATNLFPSFPIVIAIVVAVFLENK